MKKWLKKHGLRLTAGLLVGCMTLGICGRMDGLSAAAGSAKERYEELAKELEELDDTIDQLESQAENTRAQQQALNQKIDVLREQLAVLGEQINEQQAAIVSKQQEIDQKQQEIYDKKVEMADTDELFRSRVRSLYMMRSDGVLTTVLGANTYAEALTAADTLQRITQADTDLLNRLQKQKEDLEAEEAAQQVMLAEMQTMLAELEATRGTMETQRGTLASTLQQVDQTLSALDAQQAVAEEEYERLYAEYKAAKEAAEKEFQQNQGHMTEFVGDDFTWPTPGYSRISSPFGWRDLFGRQDYHTGVDIVGASSGQIYGAEIVAAQDGYVTVAKYGTTGYGICVYLDHGGNVMTRYGHCSALAVSAGEYVTKGQVIAYVGNTGNSYGAHLHFEIRVNGVAVDPMTYFTAA